MSSARKPLRVGNNRQRGTRASQNAKEKNDDTIKTNMSSSGLVFALHPIWPDLPQNQSKLFFECTLFLYSVLALFLQYLNLYKTLWWLPKSHWHSSMKFHLINPYLLSCIGLLLGMRVTICFWNVMSDSNVLKGGRGRKAKLFGLLEFAIRLFLMSTVFTSFCFSFSRIVLEFGMKTLLYFGYPICFYVLFFHRQFFNSVYHLIFGDKWPFISLSFWRNLWYNFSELLSCKLIGQGSAVHLCCTTPSRNREEAKILLQDFDSRLKSCVFTGIFTAYFSVLMPRVFVPEKSAAGEPQFFLVDDMWVMQMFAIVALTSFLLYATYLFPIQYFDLMHRCATHLGYWRRLRHAPRPVEESATLFDESNEISVAENTVVIYRDEYYHGEAFPEVKTLSAIPGNEEHLRLHKIAADPVQLVGYVFFVQLVLIVGQFWALILSSEWQRIVTLVLLMFANYLLLAKVFKDYVVISRIYKPSGEDIRLISQLKSEMSVSSAAADGPNEPTTDEQAHPVINSKRVPHNMDVHQLSGCQMLEMIGRPIVVEVFKDEPIIGNVCVIDPESRSVVLMQFDKSADSNWSSSDIVVVPGQSISGLRNFSNAKDSNATSNAELNITKAKEQISRLFGDCSGVGGAPSASKVDPKAEERCRQIIGFLEAKKVAFSQNEEQDGHKLLRVGAVRIGYPYNTAAVVSNNTNAMKKMIMHLKSILES